MLELVRVEPIALLPTQAGCAVFLGDGKKSIVFYIEPAIGASINAALAGQASPRPLTHDLLVSAVESLGAEMQDVIISELKEHTYFAKLRIRKEGELVEVDARPSDAIAVAVTCDPPLPIYVNEDVLADVLGDEENDAE